MKNFLFLTRKYFLRKTDILYQFVFFIMQAVKVMLPFLLSYIIDSYFINRENSKYLKYSICLYLFASIFYFIINFFINKYFYIKLNNSARNLQLNILNTFMVSDFEDINTINQGEINYYLFSDINTIKSGWSTLFGNLLAQLLSLIFIFVYIKFNSALSYLTLVLIIINSLVLFIYLQIIDKKIIISKEKAQQAVSKLYEILKQLECIHIYSLSKYFFLQFDDKINCMNKKSEDYFNTEKLFELFSSLLNTLWTLIVIIAGANLVKSKSLSVGSLFAFISFSSLIFSPVNSFITAIKKIKDVNISSNRISRLFNITKYNKDKFESNKQKVTSINSIELRNLNIYKSNNIIKRNINFFIPSKGIYVIKGKNGSGKTTLLKNISSLYNEYQGDILINNIEKKYLNSESLRSKIIFVDHKEAIFANSLRFNLLLDAQNNSETETYEPYIAQTLLNKLPFGMQTDLSPETNIELSNGEKQLIYIIRALLRNPSYILIDEPESALDQKNKKIVLNLLLSESSKRAIVIATHDQDFINIASEVLSFDD